MSILVTGGAGFVGVNLAEHLIAEFPGERIKVLDALLYPIGESNFPAGILDTAGFEVIKGNVGDTELLESLIEPGDSVIHMAVEMGQPDRFIETQLGGTKNVLDVAVAKGVDRFVFQSTGDVYGHNDSDDITEDAPVCATHLYSATKLGAEALVTAYHYTYDLPVTVLRPVSIYGPRQYPGWLIARFCNLAIQGEQLPVLGSGDAKRDWIHVADNCSALVATLRHPAEGEIFNIGTGREWSVIEIARMILELTDQPTTMIDYLPAREGDFDRQITRASKAREQLGWEAQVPFEDGLEQTLNWYRGNQEWVDIQVGTDAEKLGFRISEKRLMSDSAAADPPTVTD